MSNFKIGDTVIRTGPSWNGVVQGVHYLVSTVGMASIGLTDLDGSDLPGPGKNFDESKFALATATTATARSMRITRDDIINLMVLACEDYKWAQYDTSPGEVANDVFNDYIKQLSTK